MVAGGQLTSGGATQRILFGSDEENSNEGRRGSDLNRTRKKATLSRRSLFTVKKSPPRQPTTEAVLPRSAPTGVLERRRGRLERVTSRRGEAKETSSSCPKKE